VLTLVQFRHSPYNEKVRWALDLKGVAHERRSLLPGPHIAKVKALTGRTSTPVLVADGVALDGSAAIVAWLEERFPEPRLVPSEESLRDEALAIERRFDEDLTPRIRRPVLDALLSAPSYFAAVFGEGASALARFGYACVVPLAGPLVRKGNGIRDEASIEDGHRAASAALDLVAERGARSGYLVGDALSIADIAAASALAMLVRPEDSPMAAPRPVAARYRALMERYAAHPGADWVRRIYRAHRVRRSDFDGPSDRVAR